MLCTVVVSLLRSLHLVNLVTIHVMTVLCVSILAWFILLLTAITYSTPVRWWPLVSSLTPRGEGHCLLPNYIITYSHHNQFCSCCLWTFDWCCIFSFLFFLLSLLPSHSFTNPFIHINPSIPNLDNSTTNLLAPYLVWFWRHFDSPKNHWTMSPWQC